MSGRGDVSNRFVKLSAMNFPFVVNKIVDCRPKELNKLNIVNGLIITGLPEVCSWKLISSH